MFLKLERPGRAAYDVPDLAGVRRATKDDGSGSSYWNW